MKKYEVEFLVNNAISMLSEEDKQDLVNFANELENVNEFVSIEDVISITLIEV